MYIYSCSLPRHVLMPLPQFSNFVSEKVPGVVNELLEVAITTDANVLL